jgi:ribosomal protein S21
MIKRFTKKTRKEEVLKPYYERILYWETKSQKERKKKQKGIYEWRRSQKNLDVEDVKE